MHHIRLVTADLVGDPTPCGRAQRHIGSEQQRLPAVGLVNALPGGIVPTQADMPAGHVVIHHWSGGAHGLRILGEDPRHHLDPIGANHAIGVEAAENIAGGMVETIIARRNQPLFLILMQQTHRSLRMIPHELFDDGDGGIRGTVIDDDHLMWHDGLPGGVEQAIVDTLLFIPSGDDN